MMGVRYNSVRWRVFQFGVLVMVAASSGFSCHRAAQAASDLPLPAKPLEVAAVEGQEAVEANVVLAGGCFWCTEAVFEQLAGVSRVESGYAGGASDQAHYEQVSAGETQHAEVIRVTYDPAVIRHGSILQVFFGVAHDPTQMDGQGHDLGSQYRSAVFYATDQEKQVVEAYIAQLDAAGVFEKPIATRLEPLVEFFLAEDYHQDYARLHPNEPYVAGVALPKVAKVRDAFPELLKDETPN